MNDYCIEAESTMDALVTAVNQMIRDGYRPVGGPFVWIYGLDPMVCQALVKPAPRKEQV